MATSLRKTCSLSQHYLLHYTTETCAPLHFNAQLLFSGSYGRFSRASRASVVLMCCREENLYPTKIYNNSPSLLNVWNKSVLGWLSLVWPCFDRFHLMYKKGAFWVTHQTKWGCTDGPGPAALWTGVQRPFSKHNPDPLAICSLFDKDSLLTTWPCSSSLNCRHRVCTAQRDSSQALLTHHHHHRRHRRRGLWKIRRKWQKSDSMRESVFYSHWEKSFHHIRFSAVLSCIKQEM